MTGYAYKVLGPDREPWHGGSGRWAQRKRWMPTVTDVEPCRRGYHLCADEAQLLHWLGPVIWVAEYEGDVADGGDKIVVGRARLVERVEAWDDRSARHFAADCAEHVAHLNPDPRVHAAIAAARAFADGEIDRGALDAAGDAARAARAARAAARAARDAAGAAAWYAGDAAGDAARAARDARAAARAARDAARDAAWYAGDAAGDAARAARDAAGDAARAARAARAAARAARDAARDAAWYAAVDAWYAAGAAEREWQAGRLREITGGLPS